MDRKMIIFNIAFAIIYLVAFGTIIIGSLKYIGAI